MLYVYSGGTAESETTDTAEVHAGTASVAVDLYAVDEALVQTMFVLVQRHPNVAYACTGCTDWPVSKATSTAGIANLTANECILILPIN